MFVLTWKATTMPELQILGRTGLRQWYGRIDEEWRRELRGDKAIAVYREMSETDPVIWASLYVISQLMRGVQWTTEKPFAPKGSSDPAADYLAEVMTDMETTWDDFIDEALSMLVYGWSYHEILFKIRRGESDDPIYNSKYNDGKIGIRALPIRSQETRDRWEMLNGQVYGLWQRADAWGPAAFIPSAKAVHFRTSKRKNDPEGRSALGGAYRPWYFKKNLEVIEAIAVERNLAGYPTLQVPPEVLMDNAPPELVGLRTKLEKMMREIKRGEREGVLVPNEASGYKFELLRGEGSLNITSGIGPVIERKDKEILMSMLTDFLVMGHEAVGTYALAGSKTGIFSTVVNGIVAGMARTINEQLTPTLLRLNGFPVDADHAVFKPGRVHFRDVAEKIDSLVKMANAGALPASVPVLLTNTLLRDLDLPEVDEDVITAAQERTEESEAMKVDAQRKLLAAPVVDPNAPPKKPVQASR